MEETKRAVKAKVQAQNQLKTTVVQAQQQLKGAEVQAQNQLKAAEEQAQQELKAVEVQVERERARSVRLCYGWVDARTHTHHPCNP